MEIWLWALIGIMAIIIAALLLKIHILQKAASEIKDAFADRLITDTNTLIDISSRDRYMRDLASSINFQLHKLRSEHLRFIQGDTELKNAVTNISHDLRTPLTAICGYLDLLEQEEKSKTVEQYLLIIRNRAEILTQLTEELFRYSVIISCEKEGVIEPVALGNVLEESIAAFYTAFNEHGITPNIQIPEKKIIRMLDRSALTRVLSNLLNNSIKYKKKNGNSLIKIYATEEKDLVNLFIYDNGIGINKSDITRVFDKTFTGENGRKDANSTGMGLYIVKKLIDKLGHKISISSKKNEYTEVKITFGKNDLYNIK